MRRYPLAALVEASGLSEAALARSVGLSGSTLKLARENGLREDAADRYAVRAGLVPWLVWRDWLEDAAVECAERSCTARFVPARSNHRYCSHRCAVREGARRRYQDPEFRARKQAAIRAYREESKRAEAAKRRARYWADPERARAERRERYRQNAEAEKARQREYHRRRRQDAAA